MFEICCAAATAREIRGLFNGALRRLCVEFGVRFEELIWLLLAVAGRGPVGLLALLALLALAL